MTEISSWSQEQAVEWALKEFGEETAEKFKGKMFYVYQL